MPKKSGVFVSFFIFSAAFANAAVPEVSKNNEGIPAKGFVPEHQSRTAVVYEVSAEKNGISHIVSRAQYANGTTLRNLTGLILSNTPLPMAVTVLVDTAPPTALATDIRNIDNFPDGSAVAIKMTRFFMEIEKATDPSFQNQVKDMCEAGELPAIAEVQSEAKHLPLVDNDPESRDKKYFGLGNIVCLSISSR